MECRPLAPPDMPPESDSATTVPYELPEISREEISRRLKSDSLTVLDVLPPQSYMAGHIPGAINLPLDGLAAHAREVLPDPNAEIAVYCAKFT
jgi:rhodanese-related sulfurtransferase